MTRALLATLLAGLLAVTGCTTLPDSGSVQTRQESTAPDADEAPYFAPPGPAKGDTPDEVVTGFLTAMQANPPGAEVARRFLARDVRETWTPSLGTIVYEAAPVHAEGTTVRVRFSNVQRLDARGGWITRPPGEASTLRLHLVREDGEWKIADPPDALAVPASYFSTLFEPFDLFFFDQTRRVLVPQRIYLPTGEQNATNLVRRLLLGPGGSLSAVTRTAFPPGTMLELGVVVSDTDVAEVPLSRQVRALSPQDLDAALAQLARTLSQVPGVRRIRLTVDGAPVPLPGGRSDIGVDKGSELDPSLEVSDPDAVALRQGRLVRVTDDGTRPMGGPFGKPGFALRSVALDDDRDTVAAVGVNGRRAFVARTGGDDGTVRAVLEQGTDLLRPSYDMFGTLWLVDRTPQGARVHVVEATARGTRTREVDFPGISGRALSGFTVTSDGTQLVATLAGGAEPGVLVAPILRGTGGRVEGGTPPRGLYLPGSDLGPARDVALIAPTTVAVLTRSDREGDQVFYAQLDGAPGGPDTVPPIAVPEAAAQVVAGPFDGMPLGVITEDGRLLRLTGGDQWVPNRSEGIVAAAYPR